jgi:hypothetical protein
MESCPVILTKQVCMKYQFQEVTSLTKAATQLAPYELSEFNHYYRIDCFSIVNRGWRCAFIIAKDESSPENLILDAIEYLPSLHFHAVLASLGQLETFGLNRLKYGL